MENEEINLVDYIRVIVKRKWVIIIITLLAMVIAGIFSKIAPKRYEISAILEIGKIGNFVPESPLQLKEKIDRGSFNEILMAKLKIGGIPKIEVEAPKDTNLLVLRINTTGAEIGEKILKELTNIIIKEHEGILNQQRKFLEEEIRKEEAKIAILEKSKNLSELQYLYIEHLSRIDTLKNDLRSAKPTWLVMSPSVKISSFSLLVNIVIAGILGLFVSFLVAFFQEFLEKNKNRLTM